MHRLEPALDAADQRVVVEALIVRLMRLERDLVFARARRQRRVSAAAIAMAIGQIRVELKIGPAFGKAHPVRQRAAIVKQRPHTLSIDERKSFSLDALAQCNCHAGVRGGCRGGCTRIASIAIALNTAPAINVCGAPN